MRKLIGTLKKSKIVEFILKLTFQMLSLLPVDPKLVIFESYFGRQFSCNPRAIYEYMKKHCPEYKLYWSVDGRYLQNFAGHDLQIIKRFSLKWFLLTATARYWVTNIRLPLWIPKPKHTIYIQTWHGTPLKKLGLDIDEVHIPGSDTEKYKREFIMESAKWDYLVSPNSYSTKIFRRAFSFEKEIIESGYPRNDYLYQANNKREIDSLKRRYGLPLDKKVILYAPTWRDDQYFSVGKYRFQLELDLKRMQEELGEHYIVILRMHYLIAEQLDVSEFAGFAYDFSHHEDIRELYLISDLLITDYSSVFFDYANLRRPMIFFVYDIEDYRDRLRGFYFDLEKKAPGPLVKTTEEVIQAIKHFEERDFALPENFEEFYQTFCEWEDGQAAKRVVETIWGK